MNDVILQDAFDVARRHLADAVQPVHRHEIVIASCTEYPTAWVFGNEARGLTDEQRALADHVVRAPLRGRAESLNLAMAATVCLYGSARAQRARRG